MRFLCQQASIDPSVETLRQQLGVHRSLAQTLSYLHDSLDFHDLSLTFLKTSGKGRPLERRHFFIVCSGIMTCVKRILYKKKSGWAKFQWKIDNVNVSCGLKVSCEACEVSQV